jgi:methylglutaconyl-CoA hydratase
MPQILLTRENSILRVLLNRPDMRNAFDEDVISELTACARDVADDRTVRAVILSGSGRVFCSGADLGWMSKSVAYTHAENLRDAEDLARMLERLDTLPVPLIGRIHGAALGLGTGLAAVCDVAIAADDAVFGFAEVRLGILPAVISPYVLRKIGVSAARELFMMGSRFSATRAREIGLVHEVVPEGELDVRIERRVQELLECGPEAIAAAKRLIREVAHQNPEDVIGMTTHAIAVQRVSAEGQEGMRAFLEKRKASWVKSL